MYVCSHCKESQFSCGIYAQNEQAQSEQYEIIDMKSFHMQKCITQRVMTRIKV